ncbi:hypothetical protein [Nocardioides piscis]|uniref:Uncharacterized protein n=1 Tax=Nocardioides piscis TaxID=2714938 RepID=A0A6G7YDN3_9ACTN|nr:hypothetical protein [Nocardioides piscis]QIK74751.1 hypothetical protein G7071_04235 [Nocardioides piscis]
MMQDDNHLPSPLTIHLVRTAAESDDWGGPRFVAMSPQFVGLAGESQSSEGAVTELLWEILNSQSLAPDMIDAFRGAGYSEEVAQAWDALAKGANNRRYRYDPHAAVEILQRFTTGGVPALAACEYLAMGIQPPLAIAAHAVGGTPDEAHSYIRDSETPKWWEGAFDVDPWIASGFPFKRGRLYAHHCSVEEAREWEAVVLACGIADEDIRAILRANFTPELATVHVETAGQDAWSLAVEARRLIEERNRTHWANAPSPAGTHPWAVDGSEPPF